MAAIDISAEALPEILDMFRMFRVNVTGSRECPSAKIVRLEVESDLLPADADIVTAIITRADAQLSIKFEKAN